MNSKFVLPVLLLFLFGCAANKQVAKQEIKKEKILTETEKIGKELNDSKCGKCHKLFAGSDYSIKRWPGILDSMQKKAKITDEQKAQILAYLSTDAK